MRRDQVPLLALLVLLALGGHALLLAWLHQQALYVAPLRTMADPLFTRLIVPSQAVAMNPPRRVSRSPSIARPLPAAPIPTDPDEATVSALTSPEPLDLAAPPDLQSSESVTDQAIPAIDMPAASSLDSWPADTRLSYDLRGYYRGDLYGSAKVQWQREPNRYQVRIDISMALLLGVSMISQGRLGELSLSPEVYEEQLLWGRRRLLFETDQVRLPSGVLVGRPDGVQDAASQFVELSQRFASGRQVLQPGATVELWLARPEGLALWTYDVVAQERLDLPELGRVAAFRLQPRPLANPAGPISAEIWFAPSLQYLPVRIRISLGAGNYVDLWAERVEQGAGRVSDQSSRLAP